MNNIIFTQEHVYKLIDYLKIEIFDVYDNCFENKGFYKHNNNLVVYEIEFPSMYESSYHKIKLDIRIIDTGFIVMSSILETYKVFGDIFSENCIINRKPLSTSKALSEELNCNLVEAFVLEYFGLTPDFLLRK